MEVALIQWPSEEALRRQLAELHQPRLLLVDRDATPPHCSDPIEDWVRLPTSRADREARISGLQARVGVDPGERPKLEMTGTLVFRGERAHLSTLQADIARVMIEHYGTVVSREALITAAWPDTDPSENTLDVAIARLRRRLEPLGLRVRTVRSRGCLLIAV